MTAPATFEAFLVLGVMFLPGFLFLIPARRSNVGTREKLEAQDFLWMLAIGTIVHLIGLLLPFGTRRIIGWYLSDTIDNHIVYSTLWTLGLVIIGPCLLGIYSGSILARSRVDGYLSHHGLGFVDRLPSSWDFAFWRIKNRYGTWVKMYLVEGGVTGGIPGAS
jgi:hypothetical protein